MNRYWDTSALVDALYDPEVEKKASEPGQFTRPHALAEAFSTLTGGRLGHRVLADDAATLIDELTANFNFIELDGDEVKRALRQAKKRGIRGGRIHDWLHAVAAKKSGAKELITNNLSDFEGLEDGFRLAVP